MSTPSFAAFYQALWGRDPFPWQEDLAEVVLTRGWPDLLDLPTGSGKTSTLDIALYCLALAPERLPRRTLLVVDRRVVVDQGAIHARRILERLRGAQDGPLHQICARLHQLFASSLGEDPFAVAVMRGGMPCDNDWARRPDQPVVGVSTIDQVGSRLLFRGYGVGARSAAIHAGLLGNDCLLLLDEVHLAVPFMQTLSAIARRYRTQGGSLPDRFAIVRMSATAGMREEGWRTFSLGVRDRAHPVLAKRLAASKKARLVAVKATGDDDAKKRELLAAAAADEALKLQRAGAQTVAVVVNRVDTARRVRRLLVTAREQSEDGVVLVTGRMRPIDRDHLFRTTLALRVGPRAERPPEDRLIVVATQCIEAGADFDFDGLVTECASLDALRQRFGRLDRQGKRGSTHAAILGRSDAVGGTSLDPIYGAALSRTWTWLERVATDGHVDLGITALPAIDEAEELSMIAPRRDAPVLLPAHLDAWAQTSPVPDFDPAISLWLHGPQSSEADVQLVWRCDLVVPASPSREAVEAAVASLSARRPSALESISVPVAAARQWLSGQEAVAIADVPLGAAEGVIEQRGRGSARGSAPCVALRWRGEESELVTAADIRPGDILVVPRDRGGIAAGSFDPAATEPVLDVGDLAQLRGRGVASLLLDPCALELWKNAGLAGPCPTPEADERVAGTRARVAAWVDGLPEHDPGSLATKLEWDRLRGAFAAPARARVTPLGERLLVTRKLRLEGVETADALTEDDGSAFRQREISLARHSGHVEQQAADFAAALGLSSSLREALRLSGWLHDVGKADPRFQRWLVGGSEVRQLALAEPLAKSAYPSSSAAERRLAQRRAGYPLGYRHELLSLAMVESSGALDGVDVDRELVLHLVASHHGYCRPFAPAVDHPEDIEVVLHHRDAFLRGGTRHQKARLDSGVADRFWTLTERYGWWGLAWLEAILRLADHRASEREAEGDLG